MQYKVLIIFYNLTFIHNPNDYSPNIAPSKKNSTDKPAGADSLWIKKKTMEKRSFYHKSFVLPFSRSTIR